MAWPDSQLADEKGAMHMQTRRSTLRGAFWLQPIRRYVSGSASSLCPRCGHLESLIVVETREADQGALGLLRTRISKCQCCGAVVLEELSDPSSTR